MTSLTWTQNTMMHDLPVKPSLHPRHGMEWSENLVWNVEDARMECNHSYCTYILFSKLPWPGDSEGTFRSSSQAATCPSVYHKRRRLHIVPLIAERQAGKL